MELGDVQTFLAAVEQGSIARGAASLYIGQGTASQRIRRLEAELGITLLFRQAGVRMLSLTPEGEAFLPIARQWVSLQQQAEAIRDLGSRRNLGLALTEMYGRFHLAGMLTPFLQANPDIALFIQTEHATEIYQLVEQQRVDLGLVGNLHRSTATRSTPLFDEAMAVLCPASCAFAQTGALSDLDPALEVHAIWSEAYELWHQRTFPQNRWRVTAGTVGMAEGFLDMPGSWLITTEHLALRLAERHEGLVALPLLDADIPRRITYLVEYAQDKPWLQETKGRFVDALRRHLERQPGIRML